MRLLMVSHFFDSHGGGIERVAGHLCGQLADMGVAVTWAASDQDRSPSEAAFAVLPLSCINPTERLTGLPMPIPGPSAIRHLWRAVGEADAVVVHDALYVTSILGVLMAKWRGRRVVLIQHIAVIPFASRLLRALMRLANGLLVRPMLRAADELVFISDTVRGELLGDPAWRSYRLVFNGVESRVFHPEGERTSVRSEGRQILFVGRFVEKKGLSVIRALAKIRPDLTFLLAGGGPIRPSEWRLANVHDLGARTAEQLAALYRSCDLMLLPSVGEGYPLVIQEAMACGLPVICGEPSHRADPEAAQWLRGVEIDLTDPESSARDCSMAIDALDMPLSARERMAQWAMARYNWRAMADVILAATSGGPSA